MFLNTGQIYIFHSGPPTLTRTGTKNLEDSCAILYTIGGKSEVRSDTEAKTHLRRDGVVKPLTPYRSVPTISGVPYAFYIMR